MSLNALVQAISELCGCVICFFIIISFGVRREYTSRSGRIMMWMYVVIFTLLFSDAFAWIYRGVEGTTGYWMVRISNFGAFLSSYSLLVFYMLFLYSRFTPAEQKKMNPWVNFIILICIAGAMALIVNCFNPFFYYFDAHNRYHRAGGYYPLLTVGIIVDITDMVFLFKNRREFSREGFLSMGSYILLPGISMIILMFYYGISLVNLSVMVSMIYMTIVTYREHYEEMLRDEQELSRLKQKILISQIGPHFIYNSLSTIRHLCRTAPSEAIAAIDEFSAYLRTDIEALKTDKCVPFEEETENVRNYLALEKRRFGKRVNVVWQIHEKDFEIPAMSLQPIVENAVKHGITKRKEGGTVTITSEKTETGDIIITVKDNGVGFDYDGQTEYDSEHSHIGIDNVRNRLELMCGGNLSVKGIKDIGTNAVITIPAKQDKKRSRR